MYGVFPLVNIYRVVNFTELSTGRRFLYAYHGINCTTTRYLCPACTGHLRPVMFEPYRKRVLPSLLHNVYIQVTRNNRHTADVDG